MCKLPQKNRPLVNPTGGFLAKGGKLGLLNQSFALDSLRIPILMSVTDTDNQNALIIFDPVYNQMRLMRMNTHCW